MKKAPGLPSDHISFSSIKDYINCPRYFFIKRHEKKLPADSFPLQFGSMQHATVARINEAIMKSKDEVSFEDVEKIFDTEFKKYHFDLTAYQKGKENMRAYTLKTVAEKAIILEAEYPFRYKLESGAIIEGRIDRVDIPGPDQVEIIDFKSGAQIPSNEELQRDLQLKIYAYVYTKESPDFKEVFIARQSLDCEIDATGTVKGGYKKKVALDLVQLDDVGPYLEMIHEKMKAEKEFKANPDITGQCTYCPEKCKAYFDLLRERTGEANLDDIFKIGQQFIATKNQIAALTKKDDIFKALLKKHFDTNLKKDLIVGDKIIYVENMHKEAEKAPRAGYDYTKIGISNHITSGDALNSLKKIRTKAKRAGILK